MTDRVANRSQTYDPFAPVTVHLGSPAQLLDPAGNLVGGAAPLSDDETLTGLRAILLGRRFDELCILLQRRGLMVTLAPGIGQEACSVGSALALDRTRDWFVPQYREAAGQLYYGLPLAQAFLWHMGSPLGFHIPADVRMLPFQAAVAGQIPHAVGLAWGYKLQGLSNVTVVHFGDGATSQGDFHEAANLAGVTQAPVVFVCQNNQWAISTARGRQTAAPTLAQKAVAYGFPGVQIDGNDLFAVYEATRRAVARARAGEGPTLIEAVTYRLGIHTTADDGSRYEPAELRAEWKDRDPLLRLKRYLERKGRLTAETDAAMEQQVKQELDDAWKIAQSAPPPRIEESLEHVFQEMVPRLQEQRREFEEGPQMPELPMVEAIRDALHHEMQRNDRVIVLGEDVGKSGGVFRATDGLWETFGGSRVVDMPLAESVIVGASVGLALSGLVPVAEIQFMGFTHNGFNQITEQLARIRYRSWGSLSAPVTIRTPYGGGVRAPEMHSDAFEAHFAHCPGLKVVAPATPQDAWSMLLASIRDPDPVIFLEPLRGYRLIRGEVQKDDATVPLGRARVAREGTDCTVIAWSAAVEVAQHAADDAAAQGISLEVIDLRSLVPLDAEAVRGSVRKTGRVVVAQEASKTGGFGAEVIATIQEDDETFFSLKAPMQRVCGLDTPYPVQMLEPHYLLNKERILRAALRTLEH